MFDRDEVDNEPEMAIKIGVQLYTLRTLFEKDVWGTMDGLARLGFKNVELAGMYGMEAKVMAAGLRRRGLNVTSAHVGIEQFDSDMNGLVEMAKTLEFTDLIVPWINPEQHGGWKGVGEKLTRFAGEVAPHGLRVGYHNHDFEFKKDGDDLGYEVLWHHADPKKVFAELDIYWVVKGKQDPVAWLNELKGHIFYAHFKDMKKDEGEGFTEVGAGRIDWKKVIAAGEKAGLKYAVIENDQPEIDPLESVKRSREHLLIIGLKD